MEKPSPSLSNAGTINTFAPSHPHANQKAVLEALDKDAKRVLLRAGRKWRKTSLSISWLFEGAFERKDLTFPYIAPSRIQAKNIVWDDHIQRILQEFNRKGLKYDLNLTELSVRPKDAGKVQLFGVENQEGLRGISNWGRVVMDEYDDWKEDIFPLIIAPNLIPNNAPVLVTGTPKGFRNLYRFEKSGKWKTFHFTTHDNPELSPEQLAEIEEEYKELGEAYYKQEIMAEYTKPVGIVYGDWDMETRYIPFDYDPLLPLHLTWDFGVNDPTAIVFIQPNGNEFRIIDYIERSDSDIQTFASEINAKPYQKPAFEAGDIAGRARELSSGKSPIEILGTLGHHITTAKIPDIPSQIRNMNKYLPRIYVSKSNPNCERVLECFLNYKYPEKGESLINQSNEIPIHDQFSHCMRALEYYFWNWNPVQDEPVNQWKPDQWRIGSTGNSGSTNRFRIGR